MKEQQLLTTYIAQFAFVFINSLNIFSVDIEKTKGETAACYDVLLYQILYLA